VQKTVSGLSKLMSPNPETPVTDEMLEWAVRLALECRCRVKEQQKCIGSAEFRNTQFSYTIGEDGVEKFVSTPELYSEDSIGSDPLPPSQAMVLSPRQHEFSIQLRAFDSAKSGSAVGVGVLLALCSSLLQKSIKGEPSSSVASTWEDRSSQSTIQ
jgi:ATP-dependent Lon protease